MVGAGERADRFDGDVRGEQEERERNQLLSAALGVLGVKATAGEQPDDDGACEHLDQAVDAKADQGDRAGGDTSAKRDRELGDVPDVPAPGQSPRSALKPGTLSIA